jgi:hypothetical protein
MNRRAALVGLLLAFFLGREAFSQNSPISQLVAERASQDREILYELLAPDTHAFRITHDYTARKAGEQYYFNIVRAGSHVTDPESLDLDSGAKLKWEVLTGKQVKERKLPLSNVEMTPKLSSPISRMHLGTARRTASVLKKPTLTRRATTLKAKRLYGTARSVGCETP